MEATLGQPGQACGEAMRGGAEASHQRPALTCCENATPGARAPALATPGDDGGPGQHPAEPREGLWARTVPCPTPEFHGKDNKPLSFEVILLHSATSPEEQAPGRRKSKALLAGLGPSPFPDMYHQ